jgi:cobalt-precorrin-5B (C1)-methyltransferase
VQKPKLSEPNLPASARNAATTLRKGWTTGICSAAAAKAALLCLRSRKPCFAVDIPLPGTQKRHTFAVKRCVLRKDEAVCVVVKDAGDDPDVTHGAHMTATVRAGAQAGIELVGGTGVGVVTKPGLGLEVGTAAINAEPREQITAAIAEVIDLSREGVCVTISVPDGEKMARRTTNPRLGIIGGISILGTTGIVRPFSTAAWRASVGQAIDVLDAQGKAEFVLSTGGRTERAAMALFPHLEEVAFIEVGDFTGYALKRARSRNLERCFFVGMAGKLAKLAAGIMMTHWTRSKVDAHMLSAVSAQAGANTNLVSEVSGVSTARHAYELWQRENLQQACDLLCTRARENLSDYINGQLEVHVLMVDFDSLVLAGASHGARDLVTDGKP